MRQRSNCEIGREWGASLSTTNTVNDPGITIGFSRSFTLDLSRMVSPVLEEALMVWKFDIIKEQSVMTADM